QAGTEVWMYDSAAENPQPVWAATLPQVQYGGQATNRPVGGLVATAKGQVVVQAGGLNWNWYEPQVPGALFLVDPATHQVAALSTTQPVATPPAAALHH